METSVKSEELLASMEKHLRRQSRLAAAHLLTAVIALVLAAAALITVMRLAPQIEALANEVSAVAGQISSLAGQISTVATDVDRLALTTEDGVKDIMKKLDTIDFDKLNKAIQDLASVVEPLANFVQRFSR